MKVRFGPLALSILCVGYGGTSASGCQCTPASSHDHAAPSSEPARSRDAERLDRAIAVLAPLHERQSAPGPGDWLAEHPEGGQTFAQYQSDDPVLPELPVRISALSGLAEGRSILYVQPVGPLTDPQRTIVMLTADFLERFFSLPVRVRDGLPLSLVPAEARRENGGTEQILTSWVLDALLAPRLPPDAAAYIAFTPSDLWPGEGWNFVFGQASLTDRVGVWSLHRNGDPEASPEERRRVLLRTLKVAVHETAHMFSIKHCTAYACVMAGSNSLRESDRHPLWLCPHCMAKVVWATHADPIERYKRLAEFARAQGFEVEEAFYLRSAAALEAHR